jgi:hypothetical protein
MNKKEIAMLLCLTITIFSPITQADFVRTLVFNLKPDCSREDFMTLHLQMKEFSNTAGMEAEIMVPVFGPEPLNVFAWVFRYPSAAEWGKGNDAFWGGVYSGNPLESKIWKEILECIDVHYSRGWRTMAK